MATVVNFGGNRIIEPGVYAQVLSGIPAAPSSNSFGNLCIIDTGSGAEWGGGSGINGQLANGLNSVYAFEDINDFQNFVRGGLLWDIAPYIFNPASGANGPQTVYLVRASETTSAEIEFTFLGGGANGGVVKFITKNEGEGANGYEDEILAKGKIVINAPVTIGDTVDVEVDEGSGAFSISGLVTAVTTSATDLRALIIDAINNDPAGYSAYEQSGEIIVCARKKSGVNANTWPLTTLVTGTVTTTITTFANGVDGTQLSTGYAALMSPGDDDPLKFKIEFFEGAFRGVSPNNNYYSGLNASMSPPNLVATSVEFDNIDDLIQWAKTDFNFSARFELDENWIINGTGAVDNADLVTYGDLNLAINGTEDYAGDDLDRVLTDIRELDNTFFLCDRWGAESAGTQNTKIWNHIQDSAEFNKFMVVGAGIDETKFEGDPDSSIEVAKYYDSTSVVVVHSGFKRPVIGGTGTEKLTAFYHAANVVGRLGGLEPQVPITFKSLVASDFNHSMGLREREKALQAGVLHNRFVPGIGNVVNQGINTLQNNTQLINPDGTSFEISVMRIAAQLNKEMVLNLRPLFVGNNIGSASPADVKVFIEGLLISRTATDLSDNLIISFKNVTVRLIQDYYDIKYGFVPNGPINKLFVTGFMLDANLTA
jgi:hypothetical protein